MYVTKQTILVRGFYFRLVFSPKPNQKHMVDGKYLHSTAKLPAENKIPIIIERLLPPFFSRLTRIPSRLSREMMKILPKWASDGKSVLAENDIVHTQTSTLLMIISDYTL